MKLSWRWVLVTFLSRADGETVSFDTINNSDGFRFEHPFGHTFNFIDQKV